MLIFAHTNAPNVVVSSYVKGYQYRLVGLHRLDDGFKVLAMQRLTFDEYVVVYACNARVPNIGQHSYA